MFNLKAKKKKKVKKCKNCGGWVGPWVSTSICPSCHEEHESDHGGEGHDSDESPSAPSSGGEGSGGATATASTRTAGAYEEDQEWREQEMAPFADRLEEVDRGTEWLIDDGSRFKLLADEDKSDGSPTWSILELIKDQYGGPDEWAITDDGWDLAELMKYVDSKLAAMSQRAAPAQAQVPQAVDPKTRLYDLHGKGANMTPQEAAEYQQLQQQHGRPGYMTAWVKRNCKFAQA